MRVLIDLTQVPLGRMGVGSYAENLLEQLHSQGGDLEFFAVAQSDDSALLAAIPPRVKLIRLPARLFRRLGLRLLAEQIYIPYLARRYRIDVVHSLHYSLPLLPLRAARLVTMHDMTAFLYPAVHTPFKRAYMQFFIRQALRKADFLVFVSASALADCRQYFKQPLPNATVIHHGKSPAFRPALDAGEIAAVRRRYDLPSQYILYLGTLEPRKNVPALIRAFAALAEQHPEARLVVAGKKGWYYDAIFQTLAELKLAGKVHFPGYIDERDKRFLLAGATLFVYPSLYEGFGIPVLEAMACGIPVITSNVSSLPEVVGDAALLIDPASLPDLTRALERVYADADLKDRLVRAGLARASQFTWEESVRQLLDVYRDVATRHARPYQ